MRHVAAFLIRLYQWTLSPLLGPACRFYPSCSQYALQALLRFGLLKGGWLALARLARCHPCIRADSIPCRARPCAPVTLMTNNLTRFSPRLWLWVALAALLLLNYQTWIHDYAAPSEAATAAQAANAAPHAAAPASDLGSRIPEAPRAATPARGERAQSEAGAAAASGASGTAPGSAAAAPRVRVRTDVLDLDISTLGGTLTRVDLLAYPQVKARPRRCAWRTRTIR